jgi:hypothetical protein
VRMHLPEVELVPELRVTSSHLDICLRKAIRQRM